MTASGILKTRVPAELKDRVRQVAQGERINESIWLRRAIDAALQNSNAVPSTAALFADDIAPRGTRITVRLRPDDLARLSDRAAARGMRAATYVSVLVRAHMSHQAPLPKDELAALKLAIAQLSAVGCNLNRLVVFINQTGQLNLPGNNAVLSMLKICEALRDHMRAVVKTNVASWESGHAEKPH